MGARLSAAVQTGPGAYAASCTMGTGSFPGVKRPGRGADHPPPPKRRGHERVGLYLYSSSGPSWPVIGRTLPFLHIYQKYTEWTTLKQSGSFHGQLLRIIFVSKTGSNRTEQIKLRKILVRICGQRLVK